MIPALNSPALTRSNAPTLFPCSYDYTPRHLTPLTSSSQRRRIEMTFNPAYADKLYHSRSCYKGLHMDLIRLYTTAGTTTRKTTRDIAIDDIQKPPPAPLECVVCYRNTEDAGFLGDPYDLYGCETCSSVLCRWCSTKIYSCPLCRQNPKNYIIKYNADPIKVPHLIECLSLVRRFGKYKKFLRVCQSSHTYSEYKRRRIIYFKIGHVGRFCRLTGGDPHKKTFRAEMNLKRVMKTNIAEYNELTEKHIIKWETQTRERTLRRIIADNTYDNKMKKLIHREQFETFLSLKIILLITNSDTTAMREYTLNDPKSYFYNRYVVNRPAKKKCPPPFSFPLEDAVNQFYHTRYHEHHNTRKRYNHGLHYDSKISSFMYYTQDARTFPINRDYNPAGWFKYTFQRVLYPRIAYPQNWKPVKITYEKYFKLSMSNDYITYNESESYSIHNDRGDNQSEQYNHNRRRLYPITKYHNGATATLEHINRFNTRLKYRIKNKDIYLNHISLSRAIIPYIQN